MNANTNEALDVDHSSYVQAPQERTVNTHRFERDVAPVEELSSIASYDASQAENAMREGRTLLARVISRLPRRPPHALQMLTFDASCGGEVASAFCRAAAEQLGPVLQAEPALPGISGSAQYERICPDAVVPRLAHARLIIKSAELIGRGRSALLYGDDLDLATYEMIVVEFPCCGEHVEHASIASAFGGTILVAKAGVTSSQKLRASARAVQRAGGLVLGIVLAQVPSRPAWLNVLSAT